MRLVIPMLAVVALGGCAEVVNGPRVVHYTPEHFYIRYVPLLENPALIDLIAAEACREVVRVPKLQDSAQYFFFDVRDDTILCVPAETPVSADPIVPS